MSNETHTENVTAAVPAAKAKSGSRLPLILILFALAAGGVYGMRSYLDSQIPTGDQSFVRESQNGAEKEEAPTGLQVIQEMISGPGESKEITKLKGASSQKVAFTYDQISAMSKADLEKNIAELNAQVNAMSKGGNKWAGGGGSMSMGGGQGSAEEDKPLTEMELLALPLEVMRQTLKAK